MAKFDRSKFKATSTKKLVEQQGQSEEVLNNKNYAKTISTSDLDDGKHKFRIMPAHPGGDSFMQMKCVHFLPHEYEDKGKKKIGKKSIFNSKVHGNTPKDIVEEYLKFLEYILRQEDLDEATIKEKLDIAYGWGDHWKGGIKATVGWIMYAYMINGDSKKLIRLQVSDAQKKRIDEVAMIEDSDEPISTDPFTDPDTGRCIFIVKDSKAKDKKDIYKIDIDNSMDKKTLKANVYPLTDEMLEEFLEYDSLESMLVGSYKRSDFEMALEGLRLFDEDKGFGVFDYEEWGEVVEEISAYYPDEEEEEESTEEVEETDNSEEVEKIEEEEFEEEEEKEDETDQPKSKIKTDLPWEKDKNGGDIAKKIAERVGNKKISSRIGEMRKKLSK